MRNSEAVALRRSVKKVFLENSQNSQENTCVGDFIKKESLAQLFSYEFYKISKNTFLTEHFWWLLLETQKQISQEELTAKDSYESTIRFDNNKSPGNNELTKEFYQTSFSIHCKNPKD